ncbi:MAG: ABC transporter permease subunit [Caldilineae bacterium]|nr:ABC transporter permease subunit [Chloroflexota bacterium]MCB9176827.1 ABC transporter permease subunit [Caldilineae bacterium]
MSRAAYEATPPPASARRPRGELNPVLLRELRARFRSARAFSVLTTFLLFASGLAWAVYAREAGGGAASGLPGAAVGGEIGPVVFGAVLLAELLTLLLVAPGLTMAAISGEIERRTYELLLATPLSGWTIVRGKLGAAMAYLLLLASSVLPVASLAFVLGGLGPLDLLRGQAAVLVAGLLMASLGLAASALLQRTERAAILAYLGAAALCLGPLVALWLIDALGLPDPLLRRLAVGVLSRSTPLLSAMVAGREGIFGLIYGAGALRGLDADAGVDAFLLQSLALQTGLAAALCAWAAGRVRPSGRERRWGIGLAGLLLVWLVWLLAVPVDWRLALGLGGG